MKRSPFYTGIALAALLTLDVSFFAGLSHSQQLPRNRDSIGVIDWPDLSRFSRVFALSDVHGMYPEMIRLLRAGNIIDSRLHWNAGNSLVIVVGDSIDKGSQSVEVIQFWMALMKQAPQRGGAIVHLLGNHEAEFLANPLDDRKSRAFKQELQQKGIPVSAVTDPAQPMGAFLWSQPLAARLGRWLFAHAGFLPGMAWSDFSNEARLVLSGGQYGHPLLANPDSILEAKGWWVSGSRSRITLAENLSKNGFLGVVFGHQPKAFNVEGSCAISQDRHLIKIDSGMAPQAGAHSGTLLFFPRAADLTGNQPPEVYMIRGDGSSQAIPPEVPGPASASDD